MKNLKNVFFTLALFAFTTTSLWSQCPPGDVTINSLAQLNDFITDYPNCTEISGDLTIAGSSDITELSALENITEVTGFVLIAGNSALTTIDDLSGLEQVGDNLTITSNPLLANINGLTGLTSIQGELQFTGNQALTDLDGLINLETLNGGDIYVSGNPELTSVQGLASIDPASVTDLTLTGNGSLTLCVMTNLCTYLSDAGNTRTIGGNAGNCVDSVTIETACETLCEAPNAVTIEEVTETTATFSWEEPTETFNLDGYAWAVLVEGGDVEDEDDYIVEGTTTSVETNVEVTDLEPDTSYDFYVFTICNAPEELYSEMGMPTTFTTDEDLGLSNHNNIIGMYPNPASTILNFESTSNFDAITIFNLQGVQVLHKLSISSNSTSLDISNLKSGVYLVEVVEDGKKQTHKLVVK